MSDAGPWKTYLGILIAAAIGVGILSAVCDPADLEQDQHHRGFPRVGLPHHGQPDLRPGTRPAGWLNPRRTDLDLPSLSDYRVTCQHDRPSSPEAEMSETTTTTIPCPTCPNESGEIAVNSPRDPADLVTKTCYTCKGEGILHPPFRVEVSNNLNELILDFVTDSPDLDLWESWLDVAAQDLTGIPEDAQVYTDWSWPRSRTVVWNVVVRDGNGRLVTNF